MDVLAATRGLHLRHYWPRARVADSQTVTHEEEYEQTMKPCNLSSDAQLLIPFFKNGPMVTLRVLCIDPNSATYSGKADGLELRWGGHPGDFLEFTLRNCDCSPRFHVDGQKSLWIGGRRIVFKPTRTSDDLWDAFKIRREAAAALITWEKFRRWFSLDSAPSDLWDAYHCEPLHSPSRNQGAGD